MWFFSIKFGMFIGVILVQIKNPFFSTSLIFSAFLIFHPGRFHATGRFLISLQYLCSEIYIPENLEKTYRLISYNLWGKTRQVSIMMTWGEKVAHWENDRILCAWNFHTVTSYFICYQKCAEYVSKSRERTKNGEKSMRWLQSPQLGVWKREEAGDHCWSTGVEF